MPHHELLQPLHAILLQAQALHQLAQENNWEQFQVQSASYHQQAQFLNDEHYLQQLYNANLNENAQMIISEIQALNDQMDQSATQEREKIASELRQWLQAGKALDAYGR